MSYHIAYAVFGCYVAARLAPSGPMLHALALGAVGLVMSALGLHAIIANDLAPAWYGWVLVALALPIGWAGGALHALLHRGR